MMALKEFKRSTQLYRFPNDISRPRPEFFLIVIVIQNWCFGSQSFNRHDDVHFGYINQPAAGGVIDGPDSWRNRTGQQLDKPGKSL